MEPGILVPPTEGHALNRFHFIGGVGVEGIASPLTLTWADPLTPVGVVAVGRGTLTLRIFKVATPTPKRLG